MSQVNQIKRFVLQALLRLQGEPMSGELLDQVVKETVKPRPLQSDIDLATNQLEQDKFISGVKDDLDDSISWALTTKGEIKAKQF